MFTNVRNHGYEEILNRYLPGVQESCQLGANEINALESAILIDINHVVGSGHVQNHPLLSAIAVGIHLWGGNTGRNAFVQGGGFAQNCPIGVYGSMVNLLMTHPRGTPLPGGNWPAIMAIKGQFHQIKGVSFLTKHLSFWSRATNSPIRLPILDRVVKQTFIHPNAPYPTWGDYTTYVNDINADRDVLVARGLIGIDLPAMERQLFNWAAAEQVQSWVR